MKMIEQEEAAEESTKKSLIIKRYKNIRGIT
jgi:hypothetical protein